MFYSFLIFLFFNSCITQFVPQTNEDKQLLVVEGLITDQPVVNIVKLSRSLPLGTKNTANPVMAVLFQSPMILAIHTSSAKLIPEPMLRTRQYLRRNREKIFFTHPNKHFK